MHTSASPRKRDWYRLVPKCKYWRKSSAVQFEYFKVYFLMENSLIFFEWNRQGSSEARTESVNGHLLSNMCLNCIFKWTWFVKSDIWSVIDRSRVRIPVAAALIVFFLPNFLSFLTRFPFCSTPISKVGKWAAFQLRTPTYFTYEDSGKTHFGGDYCVATY